MRMFKIFTKWNVSSSTIARVARKNFPIYKCNDFNRGHLRFFNQSETDLLTKNVDFVVFKVNEIKS